MSDHDLKPLDAETWLASLIQLRQDMDRPEHGVENGLRLSFLLGRLAPKPFAALFDSNLSEAHFEQLLESGAAELAAIALLGDTVSFEIARDRAKETVSARVWIDDVRSEVQKAGNRSAAAINQAWINFVIHLVCRDCDQSGGDSHSPA